MTIAAVTASEKAATDHIITDFAAASGIGQKAGIALAATGLVLTVSVPVTGPVMALQEPGKAASAVSTAPQPSGCPSECFIALSSYLAPVRAGLLSGSPANKPRMIGQALRVPRPQARGCAARRR
ncbi:hypothetical protein PY310_15620 [Pseudarthrobacter sp. H3Y2-7]|nr:hypothetical protein [Pseudarthrobacter sp. H3Y2-7]MDE8670007.1 hypothetical protein [Pseudarthrobacter sp. H3Y2-7]